MNPFLWSPSGTHLTGGYGCIVAPHSDQCFVLVTMGVSTITHSLRIDCVCVSPQGAHSQLGVCGCIHQASTLQYHHRLRHERASVHTHLGVWGHPCPSIKYLLSIFSPFPMLTCPYLLPALIRWWCCDFTALTRRLHKCGATLNQPYRWLKW